MHGVVFQHGELRQRTVVVEQLTKSNTTHKSSLQITKLQANGRTSRRGTSSDLERSTVTCFASRMLTEAWNSKHTHDLRLMQVTASGERNAYQRRQGFERVWSERIRACRREHDQR